MNALSRNDAGAESGDHKVDSNPIPLLEAVRSHGRAWNELAAQYGVTNPDPPWKVTLEATCDLLAEDACALPALERRWEEDELSASVYQDVPFPERQLLALAHSLIKRGLVNEDELARRMKDVERRLNSA
ncbi:thiocyanate hydrolase subunit beta [Sulfuriferula plumbiphila]|uniref:Thiocyanate hydrolase subunit beta n=1 Tax=Sulfuriferula plumbiphila TaxID=171865 RepID=A0A512L9S9_9PROT|nr:hypothetical protein [Sulfuriferula plumbiphila]BBP03736.1 thiocyanate hydrolase subunit beta [Sulfuriferula plumbiphila]GEP31245.1 thiocyanate hydrolase subunit beta [Sulfuriferula plumbiphila]